MAGPTTTKTGEIVPKAPDKAAILATLVQKMTPELARALPKHVTADRMARIVLTAIRMTPELAECTQASFLGCVLSCAMLGLEPNTPLGLSYLIPRKNNKNGGRKECTLQIGYQGMIDLAGRAGVTVYAYAVRKGDDFRYSLGLEPTLVHVPGESPDRESQPVTHSYAVSVTPDNRRSFTVLTRAQIDSRMKRSPAYESGPWQTDHEAMCMKTAVRAHFRWMPKQTEKSSILAQAAAIDEAPENGTAQLEAMDPAITDALAREGIETEGEAAPENQN